MSILWTILWSCNGAEKNNPDLEYEIEIFEDAGPACQSPISSEDIPFATSLLPVAEPELWELIEPEAPLYASGGVIVFDVDGDSDFDIMSFSQSQPHLFINDGTGQFEEDNSLLPTVPDRLYNGGSAADFDNDGDPDVYISTSQSADVFLENTPNGLVDRSSSIGILQNNSYSGSVSWADTDLDGDLDLLVSGYGNDLFDFNTGTHVEPAGPSTLYINNGHGFYAHPSLPPTVTPEPFTFSALWLPINNEPPLDVLLANDFGSMVQPNIAYLNDGTQWTDISVPQGLNQEIFSMGVAITDWDSDNTPDIIITNIGDPIFLGTVSGQRADLTQSIGLMGTEEQITSWGVLWLDVNNDASEDLWIGYGPLPVNEDELGPPNPSNQPDRFLLRNGSTLVDIAETWEMDSRSNTRGGAMADFNGDGFVDMVRKPIDGPPELFMNTCNAHNWVSITLEDLVGNRSAIGSKLELKTDNHHQKRWILAGGTSFLSSSPTTAYFGLSQDNRIIELSIEWPDGSETRLTDLNVNHHITIQRSNQ
ncbi:MAG: CRTAC1 family protein [Myxococcota bacterium]